ncbi:MAG: hypothetical protein NXI10_03430 [bacterium]|nr:hypothetical protein [bacterium]
MGKTKTANQRSTVLAIYPHYRALGYAAMDTPTHVKSSNYRYLSPKNPDAYLEYVKNLIQRFDPKLVLLEPAFSRNQSRGERMKKLFFQIEELINELGYPIQHYSRKVISGSFFGLNKPGIADVIIKQFPYYASRRPRERSSFDGSETPAWCEFDALSMVITHFSQYD